MEVNMNTVQLTLSSPEGIAALEVNGVFYRTTLFDQAKVNLFFSSLPGFIKKSMTKVNNTYVSKIEFSNEVDATSCLNSITSHNPVFANQCMSQENLNILIQYEALHNITITTVLV